MYRLNLILLLFLLSSCSNKFYVHENQPIEELKLKIEYDNELDPQHIKIMQSQADQFEKNFQNRYYHMEDPPFSVRLVEENADLYLNIYDVYAPGRIFQGTMYGLSIGTVLFIAGNPQIGIYFWPVVFMHDLQNTIRVKYTVSNSLSDFPDRPERVNFQNRAAWVPPKEGKIRVVKTFEMHLFEFVNSFIEEYREKNPSH